MIANRDTKLLVIIIAGLVVGTVLFGRPIKNALLAKGDIKRELFIAVAEEGMATGDTGPTILRARLVRINFDLLSEPEEGAQEIAAANNTIRLNLFENVTLSTVLDRIERRSEESFTWFGHVHGAETSQVTLVIEHRVMVGNIRATGDFYQVRYLEGGIHVIYQINEKAFPPDSAPLQTR